MKYTVEGFQQEMVVELGLDYNDVGILRWFVDFMGTGRMQYRDIDGERFYWIKYGYLLEELPVLRIKDKEALAKRLDKMVECGILEKKYVRQGGNYTYFRLNYDVYSRLVTSSKGTDENRNPVQGTDQKPEGYRSKAEQGTDEKPNRVPMKSRNKDSSTSDPSISNPSTKIHTGEGADLFGDNPAKEKTPIKHKHGSMNNVLLTDDEMQKLVIKYGLDYTNGCIELFSLYKAEKGYSSKSDYLAILRWVVDAYREKSAKQKGRGYQQRPPIQEIDRTVPERSTEEDAAIQERLRRKMEGVI